MPGLLAPHKSLNFFTTAQLQSEFNLESRDNVVKIKFGRDRGDDDEPDEDRVWMIAGADGTDTIAMLSTGTFGTSLYDTKGAYSGYITDQSSLIEAYLKQTCETNEYFSNEELGVIKDTTVKMREYSNDLTSVTSHDVTGKLYLPDCNNPNDSNGIIYIGKNTNLPVADVNRPDENDEFWLASRVLSTQDSESYNAYLDSSFGLAKVDSELDVVPAFNLDLSTVSFASDVPAVTAVNLNDILPTTDAMTLRYNSNQIGTVEVSTDGTSLIVKGASENTYLVVQGENYAWAKEVTGNMTITSTNINSSLTNVLGCNVWLERTNANERITEATMLVEEVVSTSTSTPPLVITEGAGSTHQMNNDGTIRMSCSGPLSDFAGAYVDGVLVGGENYLLEEGSTIVMFYPEYLNTLSIGTYIMTFIYNTGSEEASFTITDAMDEVPKTGENQMIVCIFVVMLLSGIGGMYFKRKQRCFK